MYESEISVNVSVAKQKKRRRTFYKIHVNSYAEFKKIFLKRISIEFL